MIMNRADLVALRRLAAEKGLILFGDLPNTFEKDISRYFLEEKITEDESDCRFAYRFEMEKWVRFLFLKYQG